MRLLTPVILPLVIASHMLCYPGTAVAQRSSTENVNLNDIRMRDVCILADPISKTYYAVSSTMAPAQDDVGRPAIRVYTSKDLRRWQGPHIVFQVPRGFWGGLNILSIWAPEMHFYNGKYYLFATFNTDSLFH